MSVLFLPEVQQYFQELETLLFEMEYFSFEEFAVRYVQELILDIRDTLPLRPSKKAPPYFNRYGKDLYYAVFRKNKTTQWYVFYNHYWNDGEVHLLVCYISNNHIVAQHL
ncbi:hypothetical protein BHU16_03095 [Tannerella sp. oral taxon 808]|nr:hypothetical protein BHU16_03095 [Tannerella sp. oral taxon 808]